MKVLDFLNKSSVVLDLKSQNKKEVITELCELLKSGGQVTDVDAALEALMQREKLGSTGIGQGVAIPHGKTESTQGLLGALGISKKGINFESLDGEPVHVVFLLLAPAGSTDHLKALARISRLLKDKFFRQAIREAKTVEDVLKTIEEEDQY